MPGSMFHSPDEEAQLHRLIDGEFQRPRNGRKNDKAHPPIHPTNSANNLDGEEKRVYELVTRRFLASCHKNAEGKTTTVEIEIAGEKFSASGEFRTLPLSTTMTNDW